MEETSTEGFEIGKDCFNKVLKKFSEKKTKSYDFLLKGGENYKNVIYKLCERIIMEEEIPTEFHKTLDRKEGTFRNS